MTGVVNPHFFAAPSVPVVGILAHRGADAQQASGGPTFNTEIYDVTGWHGSGATFTTPVGTTGYTRQTTNIVPVNTSETILQQLTSAGGGFTGRGGQTCRASGFTMQMNCTSAIIPAVASQGYRGDVSQGGMVANNAYGWQAMENVPLEAAVALAGMHSSTQAISATTWTTLNLTNEVYDLDGVFSSGTPGTFTCQTAGRYRFSGNVHIGSNGVNAERLLLIAVLVNGVHTDYWQASSWFSNRDGHCNVVTPFIDLVNGDTVSLQVYCEIAITLAASNTAIWFCMEKQKASTKVCFVRGPAGSVSAGFNGVYTLSTAPYDPHGMWSAGQPTRVTFPVGTVRFRCSMGFGWQGAGGVAQLWSSDSAGGGGGGHASKTIGTGSNEALTALGGWKPITTETYALLNLYTSSARTFTAATAPWIQVECEAA